MSYKISPNPSAMYSDSTATENVVSITAGQVLTFDTTEYAKGITLVSNSRITLPSTGDYAIALSAVGTKTAGGSANLDFWLRLNGTTNVDRSNTRGTVTNGTYQIIAVVVNLIVATAGDYYEWMMCGDATTAALVTVAASASNPTRPAAPNSIVSVWKISK